MTILFFIPSLSLTFKAFEGIWDRWNNKCEVSGTPPGGAARLTHIFTLFPSSGIVWFGNQNLIPNAVIALRFAYVTHIAASFTEPCLTWVTVFGRHVS